jgi:alpha-beta hydrolase superfamily lysophospholipase
MSRNRVFFVLASMLGCIGVFILLVPSLVTPDLIQPQRIDSMYIEFQRQQLFKDQPANFESIDSTIFFNPGDLNIDYVNFDVTTTDSLLLRGWYIASGDPNANTILILHDWNESKILKLNLAKQMHDRGFNVCMVDLRAHGNSDGTFFSPGIVSVRDVKCMLDSLLLKPQTNHVAIFGSGISAGIALQSALYDGRTDALVLQCPYNSFSQLEKKYGEIKWGWSDFIFDPVLTRKVEQMLMMPIKKLQLTDFSSMVKTPVLFFAAAEDNFYTPLDAYSVYDSSAAPKKDLFLVKKSTHETIELAGGEQYYNSMAEFLNNALPKKLIKTRNKKMT